MANPLEQRHTEEVEDNNRAGDDYKPPEGITVLLVIVLAIALLINGIITICTNGG